MANSQGIQTLLEAEKEASKIVQKARQYRVQRLKDARTEAAKEIEALKAEKNKEFAAFEKSHSGSSDETNVKLVQDTDAKLAEINVLYEKHKEKVFERLMGAVLDVKPKLHVNVKPKA
ncbi:H+-ATPase G subunit-domain-containing protein [Cladochytrium replicatum]|nr:H+-ATPase G subunit-domain-containing protein [Cladochytrium replicatum]